MPINGLLTASFLRERSCFAGRRIISGTTCRSLSHDQAVLSSRYEHLKQPWSETALEPPWYAYQKPEGANLDKYSCRSFEVRDPSTLASKMHSRLGICMKNGQEASRLLSVFPQIKQKESAVAHPLHPEPFFTTAPMCRNHF